MIIGYFGGNITKPDNPGREANKNPKHRAKLKDLVEKSIFNRAMAAR
jgi:hypothetical protein